MGHSNDFCFFRKTYWNYILLFRFYRSLVRTIIAHKACKSVTLWQPFLPLLLLPELVDNELKRNKTKQSKKKWKHILHVGKMNRTNYWAVADNTKSSSTCAIKRDSNGISMRMLYSHGRPGWRGLTLTSELCAPFIINILCKIDG